MTHALLSVALWNEVKAELADLDRKGMMEKETASTEWISNMVLVAKPEKIQICLDPRELASRTASKVSNANSWRTVAKLYMAKVFSTLDAEDGFCQISLDEASNK